MKLKKDYMLVESMKLVHSNEDAGGFDKEMDGDEENVAVDTEGDDKIEEMEDNESNTRQEEEVDDEKESRQTFDTGGDLNNLMCSIGYTAIKTTIITTTLSVFFADD